MHAKGKGAGKGQEQEQAGRLGGGVVAGEAGHDADEPNEEQAKIAAEAARVKALADSMKKVESVFSMFIQCCCLLGRSDEAQEALATMLERGVPTKLRTYLPILKRGCEDGDVVLCAHMHGVMLHEGLHPGNEEYAALIRSYLQTAWTENRHLLPLKVLPCNGRRGDARRTMTNRIKAALLRRWSTHHGGGVRSEVASLAGSARDSVRVQPPVHGAAYSDAGMRSGSRERPSSRTSYQLQPYEFMQGHGVHRMPSDASDLEGMSGSVTAFQS